MKQCPRLFRIRLQQAEQATDKIKQKLLAIFVTEFYHFYKIFLAIYAKIVYNEYSDLSV